MAHVKLSTKLWFRINIIQNVYEILIKSTLKGQMQATKVPTPVCLCVTFTLQLSLSLFSEISTCDGYYPMMHCIRSPWTMVQHWHLQERYYVKKEPYSPSLPLSLSPKRTSAQCDSGHSGSPLFLINMHSKDELAESNQHWKRAKRKRDREHTRAHKYIQSLTCTNEIDFLRKISLQANH